MRKNDTIVAISTALQESGIAIIRISGEDAISIADKVYKGKYLLKDASSHTIHYGKMIYQNEILDEVLVMLMHGPRTFTGEDTVEINCHGGLMVVQRILESILASGACLAEPGEFTKRAFLNGKLDLSQAEAVLDVISSKNQYALKASMSQLTGTLTRKISKLASEILTQIAYIEAALDDPEHYDLLGYPKELEQILLPMRKEIKKLIFSYEAGQVMKEGIQTVILGRPNAGKSSLLNLLAGKERAIVTDIAGTTRDTITEHIKLAGISLNLTDTAGIRESRDIVESIGVEKAKKAVLDADLVLCVIDISEEISLEVLELLKWIERKKAIILLNKSDMESKISKEEILLYTKHRIIEFSAKSGKGLEELEEYIKEMFYQGEIDFNDQFYITNLRHKNLLTEALHSLELVFHSIQNQMPEDFYSIDLMNVYESLQSILGENVDDDIINEIFSKFCMGK